MFTMAGRSGTALVFAGASGAGATGKALRYLGLGSGSGSVGSGNTDLINVTGERIDFTTRSVTTVNDVVFTHDISSVAASGTWGLREFALFSASSPNNVGSCWVREGFAAVTFDGTQELQIQTTISVY